MIAPEKCEWHKSRVNFLRYIFSADGVEMDQEKIKTVLEWDAPKTVKDIQSSLGFTNFYQRFIDGYSKLTHLFTDLPKSQRHSASLQNMMRHFKN